MLCKFLALQYADSAQSEIQAFNTNICMNCFVQCMLLNTTNTETKQMIFPRSPFVTWEAEWKSQSLIAGAGSGEKVDTTSTFQLQGGGGEGIPS